MTSLKDKKKAVAKKMRRSEAVPVTEEDHKLSIKHLKDSIKFNEDHMKEHAKHVKEDRKLIEKREKNLKKI